ncbi:MAG: hypothetical protein K0R18_1016 [Bacillales bacterium]|jgi:hypothetical protein|nr:hypothetical protein [Bacillales bacterium]
MEKTIQEQMAEELVEKAHNLPEQLKKALTKRSIQDAKNLLLSDEEFTLEKLAFTIYRAYVLGAALYAGDKQIDNNHDNDDNDDNDDFEKKVISV